MTFKVLIADDETMPRQVLKEYLPWQQLSVGQVLLASDGQEALELAKIHRPDIIISDIKMPRKNGLELAAEVRSFLPGCQFLFLSGYSDKEYLKGAIRLKAACYVEKPLDLDEITQALQSVTGELRRQAAADPAYVFFRGGQPQDDVPLNTSEFHCPPEVLPRLDGAISRGDRAEAERQLQALYRQIRSCEGTSPDYIRHLYRKVIFLFLHAAQKKNIQPLLRQSDQLLYTEAGKPTLEQLWQTIGQTAQTFFCAEEEPDIPAKVEGYLGKNYANSALTVQEIADNLGFSYTYLCSAYKKSCGKTVNQRLTELRLEKAQQLLLTTGQKLYEIAHAVGYADGKYFVKVFTRETGLSPKQFRGRRSYDP